MRDKQKETKQEDFAQEAYDAGVLNPQKQHESDLTRKERRLMEKEKIKNMGFGKKLEYIWMYYKGVIFGFIGIIFLINFGIDWYENAQMETVLGISVVNAGSIDAEALSAEIKETLGYEDKYSTVSINSNLTTNADGKAFDYYAQMAYVSQIQTKEIDVLVMPESLYETANAGDFFMDMKEALDAETYEALGDCVKDDYIVLSDLSLRKKLQVGYEPVCLAIPLNTENLENARKWIASLVPQEQ